MDKFVDALLSSERNGMIPEEDDWYAPLIGDWKFEYHEPGGRHLQGEWYFRRVLEGTTRLKIRKEQGKIACTVLDDPANKWVFAERI